MSQRIPKALKQLIREQAVRRCEYCGVHEDDCVLSHRPDHIVARKHGGETVLENMAWSCFWCNAHKGTDLASVDPETGRIVRLFGPRRDHWDEHFQIRDGRIIPLTAIGRVTVRLLQFNRPETVMSRQNPST